MATKDQLLAENIGLEAALGESENRAAELARDLAELSSKFMGAQRTIELLTKDNESLQVALSAAKSQQPSAASAAKPVSAANKAVRLDRVQLSQVGQAMGAAAKRLGMSRLAVPVTWATMSIDDRIAWANAQGVAQAPVVEDEPVSVEPPLMTTEEMAEVAF